MPIPSTRTLLVYYQPNRDCNGAGLYLSAGGLSATLKYPSSGYPAIQNGQSKAEVPKSPLHVKRLAGVNAKQIPGADDCIRRILYYTCQYSPAQSTQRRGLYILPYTACCSAFISWTSSPQFFRRWLRRRFRFNRGFRRRPHAAAIG